MVRTLLILISLWAAVTGHAAHFSDPNEDLAELGRLLAERRKLMHDVAAYKWQRQLPIEDPAREDALRKAMHERAQTLGLEPTSVVRFFDLQMSWAREIQARAFDEFRRGPAPPSIRDLNTSLRPELDRIGERLLRTLYVLAPHIATETLNYDLLGAAASALNDAELDELTRVLTSIRRTSTDSLQRVRASGIVRVGLTGDYAPFSLEAAGQLSGADVQLAEALAATLDVEVRFVRTTWSTLMNDLAAGYFDVSAGGISITTDRQARASFGPVYHVGGKTPIVRCGNEQRFDSVAEIDQPGVRVVVNPGGTNERFAREHLSRAQLRVIPDNRLVFAEIEAGRADVMVTDDVEVDLQVRRSKGLCRATPQTFTTTQKAWMMPQDPLLVESVTSWMRKALQSGEVSSAIERHMH